jgi:hypothetical protein
LKRTHKKKLSKAELVLGVVCLLAVTAFLAILFLR